MLDIITDVRVCNRAFPDWWEKMSDYMETIDKFKFDTEELLSYEYFNYMKSKKKYEEADAEFIGEKDLKQLHRGHRPNAYYVELFKEDPIAVRFHKGIIPDYENTCKYCIQDKAIREQKEQHLKEYEEAQKLQTETFLQELITRQAEERKQWIETRKEHICGMCEFKTFSMNLYETHMNSREHTALANRKKWYCDCCDTQSRSDTEHKVHLNSTKHQNRFAGKGEDYVETFKCECCNYQTTRKDYYKLHMNTKKHMKNAEAK